MEHVTTKSLDNGFIQVVADDGFAIKDISTGNVYQEIVVKEMKGWTVVRV